MTNFIPHTPDEVTAMLAQIGLDSPKNLFDVIPASLRQEFSPSALSPTGKSELELQQLLTQQAAKNGTLNLSSFQGGGAYHRFIPPAVNTLAGRSEFYTAYTPYQPEVSQGTLQMIYEFQSMICELTGMDVANASVYDGSSAVGEAAFMAVRATRRKTIFIADSVNPMHRKVLETYAEAMGDVTVSVFKRDEPIQTQLSEDAKKTVAAIILQQPDYFGFVEEMASLSTFCKDAGILLVVSADPVALAVLEAPGAQGADIVCGDIQQFGNSVNFGGPYGGFIATTQKLTRQLPGRVVGRTVDKDNQTAYTLTLQTREQHIRRDKATSNICTNQSLNVLKAAIYMSLMGATGVRQVAALSVERAHELARRMVEFEGVKLKADKPFLFEFAVELPVSAETVIQHMSRHQHVIPGIAVSKYLPDEPNTLLVAVTEMNDWDSLDRYIEGFKRTFQPEMSNVFYTSTIQPMATGTSGSCDIAAGGH